MVGRAGELRFAMIGAGFWARYQIAAWREVAGVHLQALCDLDEAKAANLAREFGIPRVYSDASQLLAAETLDFVDIATGPESHAALTKMAAGRGIAVICQKPMALDFAACEAMVAACADARVPLLIHENFRWQAPMRRVRALLDSGVIGKPFRAHIQFGHGEIGFFDRQPYLYSQPHFALFDMGPHLLDLARFFLGEPQSLYARELAIHPRFAGGDIVSILLNFKECICHCELSWRTVPYEVFLEGPQGTVTAWTGGRVEVYTGSGAQAETVPLPEYAWADPAYGFAHSSIVGTNAHLAAALRGECSAETPGAENLRTMWLLDRVLESARTNAVLPVCLFGEA